MKRPPRSQNRSRILSHLPPFAIVAGVFLIYWFSSPAPMEHFDYTYRIAEALLHGRLGVAEAPSWLNELVPAGDYYYSVFPLGSVLSMAPFALLKSAHLIEAFPARSVAASLAAGSALFFFLLSAGQNISIGRRVLLALFPVLATWAWCNLAYAGAWQLALGFALMGQAGALYFTLVDRRPLLAGFFFTVAFGNRTEVLLVAPLFIYLWCGADAAERGRSLRARLLAHRREIAWFVSIPIVLGLATLAYNYARFGSIADFGYMRIPQVATEEYFKHGLFSFYSIPRNAKAMIFEGWKLVESPPYLIPHGFGGSIFISCPLLLLLFRFRGVRNHLLIVVSWIAIVVLTFALWLHANPGGWQFSYRYGMILLPWMLLILLNNGKKQLSLLETAVFVISVAINAYATYLFLWTDYVKH
ncbi:MAG: hypothetical protein ACR2H6_04225 [Pyrinomonadaceae bacterium]